MPRPKGDNGCLLFSLSFRKIRLESKWNTTYCVFPAQNIREQSNIWKGSPVFPDGIVQTKNSVQIFFNDFFDTSSGYLVPRRLSLDENVRAKEGGKETTSVPLPWSLTVRVSRSPLRCEKRSTWGGGWVLGLRGLFSVNGSDLYKW